MTEKRGRMDDHTGNVQANLTNIEVNLMEEGDSGQNTGGSSGHGRSRHGGVLSPAHLEAEQRDTDLLHEERDRLGWEILRLKARHRNDDPVDPGRQLGDVSVVPQHPQLLPSTPGHKKPVTTPDRYDGSSPWTSYQRHFELCAQINT